MIINTVSNNFREKNDIELITSRIPVNYPSAIYIYMPWYGWEWGKSVLPLETLSYGQV